MKAFALLWPLRIPGCVLALSLLITMAGCSPKAASKPPDHGTSFTLSFNQTNVLVTADLRAEAANAIRARLHRLGVDAYLDPSAEPQLRVLVSTTIPSELAAVRAAITNPGILAFRLVHAQSEELISQNQSAPGYELLTLKVPHSGGTEKIESLLVKRVAEKGLSGAIVKSAFCTKDPLGFPEINFELAPDAAAGFARVTRENIDRRLAIIIDGELFSAPRIRGEIPSGRGMITGQFTVPEASALASSMSSPLPVQVQVIEEKTF